MYARSLLFFERVVVCGERELCESRAGHGDDDVQGGFVRIIRSFSLFGPAFWAFYCIILVLLHIVMRYLGWREV